MERGFVAALMGSAIVFVLASCGGPTRHKEFERLTYAPSEYQDSIIPTLAPEVQVELYLYAMQVARPPEMTVMEAVLLSDSAVAQVVASRLVAGEGWETKMNLLLLAGYLTCVLGGSGGGLADIVVQQGRGVDDWRVREATSSVEEGCKDNAILRRVESRKLPDGEHMPR